MQANSGTLMPAATLAPLFLELQVALQHLPKAPGGSSSAALRVLLMLHPIGVAEGGVLEQHGDIMPTTSPVNRICYVVL
jgi:hypothetical protein